MHITFTQPVPWFSTPLRLLSKLLRFRTLWAYGFDSASQRAPEKSKVGEKEKYFIPFNMADIIPKNHILTDLPGSQTGILLENA